MEGKQIEGLKGYEILPNGTIKNRDGLTLKPDKGCCITINHRGKRKTFSIARLIAIYYLDMPNEKKYGTYRKDINGGYNIDNIAWDTVGKARAAINKQWHQANKTKKEPNKVVNVIEEEDIYEDNSSI